METESPGDLMNGSKNNHQVTLVERHSRFTTLIKVPSKDTAVAVAALSQKIRKLCPGCGFGLRITIQLNYLLDFIPDSC
jgi:hypothetical protein